MQRQLIQRCAAFRSLAVTRHHRFLSSTLKNWGNKAALDEEPMRFSGSDADWEASQTFQARRSKAPPYQPISVVISLTAFLVYFLYLREENDIDEYLGENVYKFMDPYADLARLKKQLAEEEKTGKDTTKTKAELADVLLLLKKGEAGALEASLKRIEASKKQKQASANE